MNKRSIILLTHEYPPKRGGAGTYCEELVHACGELGIPIEAWVPKYAKASDLKNSNVVKRDVLQLGLLKKGQKPE